MSRRIEVVAYNPTWPAGYEAEREKLTAIFGDLLLSIHHVGSTSVPGIKAKPVIDMLAVVRDDSRLSDYNQAMIDLGYTPRGECLDAGGTPGRFYYSKTVHGMRTHQVHICQQGHFEIQEMLLFPRFLRDNRPIAMQYARLKERAACAHRDNISGYIQAKEAFVKAMIQEALHAYT